MRKWLKRVLIGLAVLLVAMAAGLYVFFRSFSSSVPDYAAGMTVDRLGAPVTIARDAYAIPHILAQSQTDAAFAQGYVHAEDRLWQMEFTRRLVQGRLSEMFGSSTYSIDLMMRTLGLYQAAEAASAHLTPEALGVLDAYAAGVNAYVEHHQGRWPIEFFAASVDKPEPWRAADSIAVLKAMAFQLSGNAFAELARVRMLTTLGKTGVQSFFPPFDAAPLPGYLDSVYATTQLGLANSIPDTTASNDWVVDGAHSESGKPLLANDPHLGFAIPIQWYLVHLSYGGENLVGGTLPGVPGIVAGRNDHVAWGLTNTGPDTEDLYLEQLDPDNAKLYRTPDGWAEFETRGETIKVRFGEERAIRLTRSRHGPVLPNGEADSGPFAGGAPKGYVLALAWTGLHPDDTTFDALLKLNAAKNASDIRAAMPFYVTPMQNIVYADDSGHIGLTLPGRVPIRASGNDSLGLVPAPGWEARYDWTGYVPQAAEILDPPSGRIATANNKTVPDDYPYTLAYDWEPSYRRDRIDALLAAREKHTVTSFEAIQRDTLDRYALELMGTIFTQSAAFQPVQRKAPLPLSNEQSKIVDLFFQSKGEMDGDKPGPLIFAAFARALAQRIYADELGPNFARYWGYRSDFTLRVLRNVDGAARWCDDKATAQVEDCDSRILLALDDAIAELKRNYGGDPASWRWKEAHKAEFAATPLGNIPVLGSFFNRAIATDGGPNTILRADNDLASAHPYAAIHGSGYRAIYDLADPDASEYVLATGQSGNAFSPHYDDLMPLWSRGAYVKIPTNRDAIKAATVTTTTLQPSNAASPR